MQELAREKQEEMCIVRYIDIHLAMELLLHTQDQFSAISSACAPCVVVAVVVGLGILS